MTWPWPNGPGPPGPGDGHGTACCAPLATVASSVGPTSVTTAAPARPTSAPSAPPSAPCASDSPATWRTTSRCGQPSAFSVPSSRTRLFTDERVSRLAIRNAAPRPITTSARPSLSARPCASSSEPPTRSARSLAVVTCEPENEDSIACATFDTESGVARSHVHRVHAALAVGQLLQLPQLHVHVRRLAAERRLRDSRRRGTSCRRRSRARRARSPRGVRSSASRPPRGRSRRGSGRR